MTDRIAVENVNQAGHVGRVDAAKYHAMTSAMLRVTTGAPPMTAAAIKDAAKMHLTEDLFPGGATAGWWVKCMQLDLEARGVSARNDSKPLTLSLA